MGWVSNTYFTRRYISIYRICNPAQLCQSADYFAYFRKFPFIFGSSGRAYLLVCQLICRTVNCQACKCWYYFQKSVGQGAAIAHVVAYNLTNVCEDFTTHAGAQPRKLSSFFSTAVRMNVHVADSWVEELLRPLLSRAPPAQISGVLVTTMDTCINPS